MLPPIQAPLGHSWHLDEWVPLTLPRELAELQQEATLETAAAAAAEAAGPRLLLPALPRAAAYRAHRPPPEVRLQVTYRPVPALAAATPGGPPDAPPLLPGGGGGGVPEWAERYRMLPAGMLTACACACA